MQPAHDGPHKYIRARKGKHTYKKSLYKCAVPGCAHSKHGDLVIGRFSICNFCGNTFTMNKESVTLARPRCDACRKGASDNRDKLLQFLEKI